MTALPAGVLGLLAGLVVGCVAGLLVRADNMIRRHLGRYGVTVHSARLLGRAARLLRAAGTEAGLHPGLAAAWVADYDAALNTVGNPAGGRR